MNNRILKPTAEEKRKVLKSLESPKFKWRTLRGVAQETGLDIATVEAVISQKRDKIVRSSSYSTTGQELYTTRNHFNRTATPMEKLIGALRNRAN